MWQSFGFEPGRLLRRNADSLPVNTKFEVALWLGETKCIAGRVAAVRRIGIGWRFTNITRARKVCAGHMQTVV